MNENDNYFKFYMTAAGPCPEAVIIICRNILCLYTGGKL